LFATSTVEHLPELEIHPAGRIDAYVDAVSDLALALTQLPGQQNRDWKRVTFDLRTRAQDAGLAKSALILHLIALADLLDAASPALRPRTVDQSVEDRLISHERRYWIRAAEESKARRNLSPETLLNVLAGAMLMIPDDRASADRLLQAMPTLESRDMRGSVRRLVALLYPPSDGKPWAGLRPDRPSVRPALSRWETRSRSASEMRQPEGPRYFQFVAHDPDYRARGLSVGGGESRARRLIICLPIG
jgi:hypothetical protein